MSQFQNQNPLIEYRGRQAFEQPVKPFIYQEQMPILPTPSLRIGYSGINLAEIGYLAAKAGTSIVDSLLEYDFRKKQEALSSIQTETESELDAAYRNGADNDTIDGIRNKAKSKIDTILNVDIDDPTVKEEDFTKNMGTKPGSLILAGRKAMVSIDSSNGRYKENLRASTNITNANLAVMQVAEEFAKNPNASPELYDTAIDSVERIIKSVLPQNATINSSTISQLQNPADRETAMKAYTALIKLREDKLELLSKKAKAQSELEEDMTKAEVENRKKQNEGLRDTLKRYGDNLTLINERLEYLQKIPQEERTPETSQEIFNLVKQYYEIQDGLRSETIGFTYGRYGPDAIDRPSPQTGEPLDFDTMVSINPILDYNSEVFDSVVVGDAAIDTPTVREAYGQLKSANLKVENQIGTTRLNLIKNEKKEQTDYLASFWKQAEADIVREIALYEAQGTLDSNKTNLLQRLEFFNSKSLDTIIPFLGEDKIREIHKQANLNYEDEKKKGFPKLKESLSLATPVKDQELIHSILGYNSTAWDNWNAASLAYKGLETKIFKEKQTGGSGTGAKEEEAKIQEALGIMAGRLSNGNVSAEVFSAAADRAILRALSPDGTLDLADIASVGEAVRVASKDPQGKPIQLDVLVASRATATMYTGAKTASEVITAFGSVLPKDAQGNVIIPQPSAWPNQVNGTSFPIVRLIEEDLKKDSNSQAFQKALVMFAMLPEKWRDQLVSAVGKKGIIRTLNEEIKNRKGTNIQTLTSIASRGGYTDELIKEATELGEKYAERALYTRTKIETTSGDESVEEVNERTRIVNGVIAALTAGPKDEQGNLIPFQNGFKPLPSLSAYRLQGSASQVGMDFKWIVSRATKYYTLYKNDPNIPNADHAARAIKEAIQEFKDERLVTPRGTVDMGTMSRDLLFGIDATGSFPEKEVGDGRLYPNQNPNSVILDQDPIDFVLKEAPAFKGKQESYDSTYGFRLGNEPNPANKKVYFANAVVTSQNNNGGLSVQNRVALARLKFNATDIDATQQGIMLGELIEATLTSEETTTRRDILVASAVLKEIELAQQNPTSDFESWDQVITFVRNKASEIRTALKDSQDKPTSNSPYTIMLGTGVITSSTGNREAVSNLQLLRKLPDGSWQIMANIQEDFASAGYGGYTRRNNATNLDILSGVGDYRLAKYSPEELQAILVPLYEQGLLRGSFRYRLLGETRYDPKKNPDPSFIERSFPQSMEEEQYKKRDYFEEGRVILLAGDQGNIPVIYLYWDEENKKLSIERKTERWGRDRNISLFRSTDDINDPRYKAQQPQFSEEESRLGKKETVQKETVEVKPQESKELSPLTNLWIEESKRLVKGRNYTNVPFSTALMNPEELKQSLTVVKPTASIEEAIQYPGVPLSKNNTLSMTVNRNPKDNLYYVVPNKWKTEVTSFDNHLGGFYNKEDAQRYLLELQLFMARQQSKEKTQPTPDSLSSVMNFYMPTMG